MKYKHFLLTAVMTASGLAAAADPTNDRISQLENEINILKSQKESRQANTIRFNGFFSVGATTASNNLGYVDSSTHLNVDELTKLGLQASFDIDDSTHVTTQMLAKGKGDDNFEANIEWAYVSHTFDNDTTLRAGKLRLPLFIYSDFLDVGIAQPWARPPEEVYGGVAVNTYLGMDYSVGYDFDASALTVQIYGGEMTFTSSGEHTEIPSFAGVVTSWSNDTLTLRGTYLKAQSINNRDEEGAFYGLGASYDNSQLLIIGEIIEISSDNVEKGTNQQAAYVTLGYRVDAWLPYVTLARTENTKDKTASNLKQQLSSYSLGAKYNLASNMSIKADATYVNNFGDTTGVVLKNTSKVYDDAIVYTVRFDTVF